jgi:hypothetical protein
VAGVALTSDSRYKTNVKLIDADAAIYIQENLSFYTFDKLVDPERPEAGSYASIGVIANELQALTLEVGAFESLVTLSDPNDEDSYLVVDYVGLDIVLSAATQARLSRLTGMLAAG